MFDSECFCFIYLLCLSAKIEHLLDFGITFEQGFAPLLFFRFLFGVLVVFLAAYSLVMDFESIQAGVQQGAPRVFGWQAAFGIMVTVVWLYVEILRLLAILRGE